MINLKNILCVSLTLLLALVNLSAQEQVFDYSQKKDFYIGDLKVEGAGTKDPNAIKSIAGLKIGDKIEVPGNKIPDAIKSLLRLKLFKDVRIILDSTVADTAYLRISLEERPVLSRYSFSGVKNSQHDDLNELVSNILSKGGIVTEDQKSLCAEKIREFYVEKGKLDAKVKVIETPDNVKPNTVKLDFAIAPGDRVKVEDITFEGNKAFSDRKLRKKMKHTKRKGTLLRKTKFIKKDFEEDEESVIAFYNTNGYRDAKIIKDSMWREEDGDLQIKVHIDEGNVYHFRNIKWKGNSLYSDEQLSTILGIEKGDVYNPELLENRLRFSLDGRDVSSLYLDDGYLGFEVNPVELIIPGDSIDIEMRIYEGPQFTIGDVTIEGNDRTHEHVIRRELRTRPGDKFSRSDIIRSQREIINLGYFNPENMDIQTPVNQQRGTVDIKYKLEERPSDQLELSAGYGGFSGLIGTLGVTFNNFSLSNIKDRSTWSPLPTGDGQKLSFRLQSNSRFFRSLNFSFTEPWLGGRKRNGFTVGAVSSSFDYTTLGSGSLSITRAFVGLGKQLSWPDDFFVSNTTLNFEFIDMADYRNGNFYVNNVRIYDGSFKNFSIKQSITRSSISDPLFPRSGSRVSLAVQLTPPYSLFRKDNYYTVSDSEITDIRARLQRLCGPACDITDELVNDEVASLVNARRFEYLEYHKWTFDSEWYFNLVGKLVLKAQAKFGYLGTYKKSIGVSPFERFELGGDGLSNQSAGITGRDIISLRGYETSDFPVNNQGGAAIYDKITMELRYPLSLNPNSTIFLTGFLQGGNAWSKFGDFNPFDMKRSAGVGMRVFLPMFGLLGFDYGFGFDKNLGASAKWTDYSTFNIVLGFEPE